MSGTFTGSLHLASPVESRAAAAAAATSRSLSEASKTCLCPVNQHFQNASRRVNGLSIYCLLLTGGAGGGGVGTDSLGRSRTALLSEPLNGSKKKTEAEHLSNSEISHGG